VWSDQLGHKLQMLGDTRPTDELTCVSGALEAGKFAFAASRAGRLTGLIASDSPREVARYRPHIAASTLLEDMLTDGLRAAGTAR
jgi:hypothetical protein